MFTWALSVQILTLEVLVFAANYGQQWQEAEITAIRERAELNTKDQAKLPTIPGQDSSRPLASPLPISVKHRDYC